MQMVNEQGGLMTAKRLINSPNYSEGLTRLWELKSQSLRGHVSAAELSFTALEEISTLQIAETREATGMDENSVAAKTGGKIAKNARVALEDQTERKVVTKENHLLPVSNKAIEEK
jgi:hypothetical protein